MNAVRRDALPVFLIIVSALLFGACGGGNRNNNNSGGPSGAPSTLSLNAQPAFGIVNVATGVVSTQAFNVTPATPGGASQLAPNSFANPLPGEGNFLQFNFNTTVDASSIMTGTFAGADGIEVRDAAGNLVPFFLDSTGAIDPSNAFPQPNEAPATLRLYFQAAGQPAGTLGALAADSQYTVNLVTSRLKSFTGGPFCLFQTGGLCTNPVEVIYGFGTGADTTAITVAANPSVPLVNAIIPIDQEIRVFFSENVDFRSIVGVNPNTGMANVTQLDAFMSVPFPLPNVLGGGGMPMTSMGENLSVAYAPPPGEALGPNYAFVVYMPDPFHNPTEIRIRFVDGTFVQPSDATPLTQNYGLDSNVWTSVGLQAPVNNQGLTLNLPPKLPLPGSSTAGTAALTITLFSTNNPLASDTSIVGDGILGITDRSRQALQNDFTLNYTMQMGPQIANNPSPPDLNIVTNGAVLDGFSNSSITTTFAPGGTLTGTMFPLAQPLDDPMTLGTIRDVVFGPFINVTSPTNVISNPPGRLNPNMAVATGVDPGVPFPQGGTPEFGRDFFGLFMNLPPVPPLGVRLYVTDDSDTVKIFDSNTFLPLGVLTGVPSAYGLGRDRNQSFLYVSNFDQNSIQRIGINPASASIFHQVTNTITVGANPTVVTVHPDNEVVCVLNTGEDSFSVVGVATAQEREKFPVGMGANEIMVTSRHFGCPGCPPGTVAWSAFIPNLLDNTVTIFESDSPSINVQNGNNGRVLDFLGGFSGPKGGIWNQVAYPNPGFYIANSTGGNAVLTYMLTFQLQPPPGFPGVPAFRNYTNAQTYTSTGLTDSPHDVIIDGLHRLTIPTNAPAPFGFQGSTNPMCGILNGCLQPISIPQAVLFMIHPGDGQVAALDINNGTFFGSITVPGDRIYNYFDQ